MLAAGSVPLHRVIISNILHLSSTTQFNNEWEAGAEIHRSVFQGFVSVF